MPEQVVALWRKLKEYLQNVNLFPSVPPTTDEYELRTQRISTRLFLFIFSTSFIILLLYNSITINPKSIYVKAPSFTEYVFLNSTYSKTLICPCSNISINYNKFTHIEYTFHQVCSSIFVNQAWIKYLSYAPVTNQFRGDFRQISPYSFQTLKAFCELINRTISDSLVQFYSSEYISASVIPENVFKPKAESVIEEFRSSVKTNFILSLSLIRDTTQANALVSGLQTNYYLFVRVNDITGWVGDLVYGNCSCSFTSKCVRQVSIYEYPSSTSLFDVPDFYIGCYVIEAVLQSTLKCFYNQSCIDQLIFFISSSVSMNITALDTALPTRYLVNSTIEELVVDNLMIEKWNGSIMYETYYNACQPTHCNYTVEARNDFIYIVTALFGAADGLMMVLKLNCTTSC